LSGQRVHDRHDIELPVTIVHEGRSHTALSQNLSLGGLLINGPLDVPFGAAVTLELTLPGMKAASSIAGTVRWANAEGVGVQFGQLRAKEVWAINQLFKAAR